MKFICIDGIQLCSKTVLQFTSDWFTKHLNARENFKNQIVFDYSKPGSRFTKKCICNFLNIAHGIEIEVSTVPDLLELVKFIQYEGKNESHFEKNLFKTLSSHLAATSLSVDVKLLICVVSETFDNFNDFFSKVSSK